MCVCVCTCQDGKNKLQNLCVRPRFCGLDTHLFCCRETEEKSIVHRRQEVSLGKREGPRGRRKKATRKRKRVTVRGQIRHPEGLNPGIKRSRETELNVEATATKIKDMKRGRLTAAVTEISTF